MKGFNKWLQVMESTYPDGVSCMPPCACYLCAYLYTPLWHNTCHHITINILMYRCVYQYAVALMVRVTDAAACAT